MLPSGDAVEKANISNKADMSGDQPMKRRLYKIESLTNAGGPSAITEKHCSWELEAGNFVNILKI